MRKFVDRRLFQPSFGRSAGLYVDNYIVPVQSPALGANETNEGPLYAARAPTWSVTMTFSMPTLGKTIAVLGTVAALALPSFAMAQDNEYAEPLTALANSQLRVLAQSPAIVAAIEAQNAITGGYDQAKIDELDTQWRAEVGAASKPLIDATLGNAASKELLAAQDASAGLFTEIFVMDAKGLNVGQSTVTSDYWQGDEDKWQQTFSVGAHAVHLGEIEQDESTQAFQSQISITIVDAAGMPIGAVTAGVDLAAL